ncbi:hypothetical protein GCM10010176_076660 [Nonomuraea spiralis]|nr:hypothetical protein GCM10010176_076660 [Nonomuraea spiralis]
MFSSSDAETNIAPVPPTAGNAMAAVTTPAAIAAPVRRTMLDIREPMRKNLPIWLLAAS